MKIVRTSELPWSEQLKKGKYDNRRKALGGEKLSAGLWELPPGRKSFPLHRHLATEEALWVVSGRAKVRTTEGETALGPGDFVSFPAGGLAHQLVNDGDEAFVYVGLSVSVGADVVEYPESGKLACSVGAPGKGGQRHVFKLKDEAQYFEGDKDAEG